MQEATDKIKKKIDPEKIKQALIQGGLAIEAEAKRSAQVDTGRLRASYSTNWDDSGMSSANVEAPAKAGDGVSQPSKGVGDIAVVRVGTNVEYACVYNSRTPVYSPNEHSSHDIGTFNSQYVLSKDGLPHKILKKYKFYQKKLSLVEITVHTRRNPLTVTENHLILILRDSVLIWEAAKNLRLTDLVFTKRSHNAITDDSNKKSYICKCGKEFKVPNYSLNESRPNPTYCCMKCRHKYGPHDQNTGMHWAITFEKRRFGEKNPQWKDGLSKKPYDWRFNNALKDKIKNRDNNECQICSFKETLVVHHKDSDKLNSTEENLITLCRHCHAYVTQGKLACELPEVSLDKFKPIPIKKLRCFSKERKGKPNIGYIYDFSIDNENSYYAGGLLIHNSFIEYGTRSIQPYMTVHKAALRLKSRIEQILKDAVNE